MAAPGSDAARGVYRVRIQLDGQRRWVSAKTQKAVLAKVDELRQQHRTYSIPEAGRLTVAAYLKDWLELVVKKRRRLSTYAQYESLLRVHVYPRLGARRLLDLRPRDIEQLYATLEAGVDGSGYVGRDGQQTAGRRLRGPGLSPKSIRNLHTGLHAAFARAVNHNLLPRNPADHVELPALERGFAQQLPILVELLGRSSMPQGTVAPKGAEPVELLGKRELLGKALERRNPMPIDVEDLQRLQRLLRHSQAEGDRNYPLWVFLANTGLRIGEALALRWANVDLDSAWFSVTEGLSRAQTAGDVKTEAGVREVPLTTAAVAALGDQRKRIVGLQELLQEGFEDHHLVFPTSTGRATSERNALRALVLLTRRAGLGVHVTLHDFRRMAASPLVASGVDIVTAAAILGHKNASILLDVYARAQRAPKRAAAVKLQAVLYPADVAPALPA